MDVNGNDVKKVTVDGKGTYTIDPKTGKVTDETTVAATYKGKIVGKFTVVPETGEIIFTPNKDYVGKVDPVMIQINDENGTPARATYQPEVFRELAFRPFDSCRTLYTFR